MVSFTLQSAPSYCAIWLCTLHNSLWCGAIPLCTLHSSTCYDALPPWNMNHAPWYNALVLCSVHLDLVYFHHAPWTLHLITVDFHCPQCVLVWWSCIIHHVLLYYGMVHSDHAQYTVHLGMMYFHNKPCIVHISTLYFHYALCGFLWCTSIMNRTPWYNALQQRLIHCARYYIIFPLCID